MYDAELVRQLAEGLGFKRRGNRNWVRRTPDLVQLVNLQLSQWAAGENYLNFAVWPLALGEPPSIAESKFLFRIRAEDLGAADEASFFDIIARQFDTLDQLRSALASRPMNAMVHRDLRTLIAQDA